MKQLKKGVLLLLALALALCSFASCSAGQTAMWYGDQELSESDYAYLMAFIKGYYEYYYSYMAQYYGGSGDLSQMWDTDIGDGRTFAEMLTESVNDAAKMMLVVEQLCAEAGLTVQDAESLKEISDAMQELTDNYGGQDALEIELAHLGLKPETIERYETYNLLLNLLRDYRYGDNGVARLSREEVQKAFKESYVKAEAYLYSYLMVDENNNRAMYLYDFASEYAEEDVRTFFTENFLHIRYLRFEAGSQANAAYTALIEGTSAFEDYLENAETAEESAFVTEGDMSDTIYEGISAAAENGWFLSGEEDGYYYAIQRLPFTADDLDEATEKKVRDAMVDRDARAYFKENFVTVQHILYYDEAKAKEVYDALVAGTTTFDEHKGETQDNGLQYSFTHGSAMVDEFEEGAFSMEIGGYTLVESEFGWHVMTRLEPDFADYKKDDAVAAMSQNLLREKAQQMYEAIKSGSASFEEPADDALYSYSKPTLLALAEQNETLAKALEDAAENEVILVDLKQYGVFVLRKHATTDEDLDEVYADVEEPLIADALYDYLESFFDAVRINSEVIGRFDIRTAKTFFY